MRLSNVKFGIAASLCLALWCCKPEKQFKPALKAVVTNKAGTSLSTAALVCTQQTEQTDYTIYKMTADGYRVGDMAPFFDAATNKIIVYFLKDIWNDATNKRHPLYAFTTTNFFTYTATAEIISSSSATCAQDNAVGAASIVKNGSTYYAFYSGHNNNYTTCGTKLEGIMRASSTNPTLAYTKNTSFSTINLPTGQVLMKTITFTIPTFFWMALPGICW
ncbi:glycoside hydrolase family protein [Mucilaginibacter gilvus]|uniref:Glycosyl hydrolase family 32 N-terminal domain-containing protein n=1 Tax=Mucilaginibacter gilvus TaxID=2305909 RepID=A0A444MLB8_9SPHI|nr:hypothetical protein [Mucilaginibacter gilvus]RWY50080.1 hypothetical protein EPL05_15070 [Mucilaginibacter gilvus]